MSIKEAMEDLEITKWHGSMAFVYQSWLKSLIGQTAFLRGVPAAVVYRQHRKVIDRILSSCDVLTLTLKNDPDFIMGYAVACKIGPIGIVHYVYVKRIYQRMGVAALLIQHIREHYHGSEHLPMVATHQTEKSIERLKGFGLVYNPYILISGESANETKNPEAGARNPRRA